MESYGIVVSQPVGRQDCLWLGSDSKGETVLRLAGGASGDELDRIAPRSEPGQRQVDLIEAGHRSGNDGEIAHRRAEFAHQPGRHDGRAVRCVSREANQQTFRPAEFARSDGNRVGIRLDRPEVPSVAQANHLGLDFLHWSNIPLGVEHRKPEAMREVERDETGRQQAGQMAQSRNRRRLT